MTEPKPPDAKRIRARALVLAAVSCRGIIEAEAAEDHDYAEQVWSLLGEWAGDKAFASELEPDEAALLAAPLGTLEGKEAVNASWRSEGMVVLAWAIGRAELPDVMTECEPNEVAERLGLSRGPSGPPVRARRVSAGRIEAEWNTYLALHWRLREYSLCPEAIDFVTYARECDWAGGPLIIDRLPIRDLDLAIGGKRIDKADYAAFRQALSIASERHQAFNWLLGDAEIYSEVTTDT